MTQVHLTRLEATLSKRYFQILDRSSLRTTNQDSSDKQLLSQALAAHAIQSLARTTEHEAANAVVDEFDDCGIDAIYFDKQEKRLLLCQSKWKSRAHGSVDQASIHKFLSGVEDLLNLRLDAFGGRTLSKAALIESAVLDSEVLFTLVITHTGVDTLAAQVKKPLHDFLNRHNTPSELFALQVLNLGDNYDLLLSQARGNPISINVSLRDWGKVATPYSAYYGRVPVTDIAQIWREHKGRLFAKNIRDFRGSTEINTGIADTIRNEPESFWFFNNGITLLCQSIKKKPLGGNARDHGIFECHGVSVVNGAQTVGQIGRTIDSGDVDSEAQVMIRLISLEGCPDGFDRRITKATNTQNRVEGRDFAALDKNQRRLAEELQLEGLYYAYRSGEQLLETSTGCTLTDAAIALACSLTDVSYAVIVKNRVGKLFDNLDSGPYTAVFGPGLTAHRLWNAVRVMRAVDRSLAKLSQSTFPKAKLLAAHANRFILHLVFKDISLNHWSESDLLDLTLEQRASRAADRAFARLANDLQQHEPSAYPQPLFKTLDRCRRVAARLNRSPPPPPETGPPSQAGLFD